MIVQTSTLAALRTSFSTKFNEAFSEATPWSDELASELPSSGPNSTYAFNEALVAMREWIGPREVANAQARSYVLTNRDFEATVGLDRNDIEDDNLGLFSSITMPGLGVAARKNADTNFGSMLFNNTDLCYDGLPYFDNNHTMGPDGAPQLATIDNLFTLALDSTNFLTVWNTMVGYQDGMGRSLGVVPSHLCVPPQLYKPALDIVAAALIATGGTNTLLNFCKVKMVPEWSNDPTAWYLADLTKPLKPLVKQTRKAAQFVSKDQVTDDNVFHKKVFLYGADSREAFGYSLPALMAKSKP